MRHLDEGTLHALLDGEIPSAELPPIQAHLGGCAECRARLAEEQDLLAESDRLIEVLELPEAAPAVAPVRTAARRVWPARLAWAATVVLAAGLGYSIREGPAEPVPAASLDSAAEIRAAEPAAPPTPPAAEPLNQSRDQASAPKRRAAAPPPADARREPVAARNAAPAEEKAEQRVGKLRMDELVVTGTAPSGALADRAAFAVAQPASLPEAIGALGGSLRLINGMIPERLEILGRTVRVVYRTGSGELLLSQELVDGQVRFTLIAPPGFPADSLERLRGRVRE